MIFCYKCNKGVVSQFNKEEHQFMMNDGYKTIKEKGKYRKVHFCSKCLKKFKKKLTYDRTGEYKEKRRMFYGI